METLSDPGQAMAILEERVRSQICSVCVDRSAGGTCGLSNPQECGLFSRFSKIVESVSRVHSDKIEDYITAIREDVCENCINERLDGFCQVREEVRCVLDRYLLLIVDAIEEANRPLLPILQRGMVLGLP